MAVQYTPLPVWPHPVTADRRHAQFRTPSRRDGDHWTPGAKTPYSQTIRELEYEVELLQRRDQPLVVQIGAGYRPGDVRRGQPRADARAPMHPGVEVSFDTRYGRLTYATDVFLDWRDNVRAIAKGLEALRAIDRWGVAKRGQQYAGFGQITAGGPDAERGRKLVERAGGLREAMRAHHPDLGGEERDMVDILAYRDSQSVGA